MSIPHSQSGNIKNALKNKLFCDLCKFKSKLILNEEIGKSVITVQKFQISSANVNSLFANISDLSVQVLVYRYTIKSELTTTSE